MNTEQNNHRPIGFIRQLCAHKSEEEILEAEERFRQYLEVIKGICLDLEAEELDIDNEQD